MLQSIRPLPKTLAASNHSINPLTRKRSLSRPRSWWTPTTAEIVRRVWQQFKQLCRAHHGLHVLHTQSSQLPAAMGNAVDSLASKLELVGYAGAAIDLIAIQADHGWLSAILALSGVLQEFETKQVARMRRISGLARQVGGDKLPSLKDIRKAMRLTSALGPQRVEGLLGFMVALNRKFSAVFRPAAKQGTRFSSASLSLHLGYSGMLAIRRTAELKADRLAAQAMKSINMVAAGLVLIHGTPAEKRRLARGELDGLLDDAALDIPPSAFWATWLRSVIDNRRRPPLNVRLAALKSWATSAEGQSELSTGAQTSWFR